MASIDLAQIVAWTRGRLVQGSLDTQVDGVSTDSREMNPGACFVPLVGERFDGHQFVVRACEEGARAVLTATSRWPSVKERLQSAGFTERPAVVAVDDTLAALQAMARGYRLTFDVPVIAVTGSNGKTTTKEMIASILGTQYPVCATAANLNNHIGVPLTTLSLERSHRALIVEMGMNSPGEIALLASIAAPHVGVVTNVGPVHLERLIAIDRVAEEKGRLIEALPGDGVAVLNADDGRVRAMAARTKARAILFGHSDDAAVKAERVESRGLDGTRFLLTYADERVPVTLKLPGRHQVMNALAAAAVALTLDLPVSAVQEGLLRLRATPMRMEVKRLANGVTLVDDAYNASPLSMKVALQALAEATATRRIAVLGGMRELGGEAERLHREVGAAAAGHGVDLLIVVGDEGRWIADGAVAAGLSASRVAHFPDVASAAHELPGRLQSGDVVLVKASRGVRLEGVTGALERAVHG